MARGDNTADTHPVEVLNHLLRLTNRLMTPFSTYLSKQHAISLNEFRVLMLLGRYGPKASHELAELTGVGVMSVSRAVSALEKHGRITAAVDPANRRRKVLALTGEGQALYDAMRPATRKVADFMLSDLSPAEVTRFMETIDRLTETIDAVDENGNSRFLAATRP